MSKPLSVRVEPIRLSRWREGKEKMGIGSMSGYVKYCVDKVTNEQLGMEEEVKSESGIRYACGYKEEDGYGMFAGPYEELYEALEKIPDWDDTSKAYRTAYIFELTAASQRKLYRWRGKKWRALKGRSIEWGGVDAF